MTQKPTGQPATPRQPNASEVAEAMRRRLKDFVGVGIFSAAVSLLTLTGSFYMLQVYDRVLVSRSVDTLIGLSLIALAAYVLQGFLDALRGRMLTRIGADFSEELAPRVYDISASLPLAAGPVADRIDPVKELDHIRSFLASLGPTALFDIPFMPIFFIGTFMLHPVLGYIAVFGGVVLIALTFLAEWRTRKPAWVMAQSSVERNRIMETTRRHIEAVEAMGIRAPLRERWLERDASYRGDSVSAADAAGGIGAFAKVFRVVLQSGILGAGAYLALNHEVSPGAMIAASIMSARALAPIEIALANWRGFVSARQGYGVLTRLFAQFPPERRRTRLPTPKDTLVAEDLYIGAPGSGTPIVSGATLRLVSGQALGIVGPSASGKSTLARALVGLWSPLKGRIRLDGAELQHWDRTALGRHIGYLPQDVSLFDATVSEIISRFDPQATSEAVIAAARAADAHEMILGLPNAYETRVGDGGTALSGGQRQRIALARALYGDPFLVVLDEPNSHLDGDGDAALHQAVHAVRERGGIVVLVTHRPSALYAVEHVAVMAAGRIQSIGPKDEIMRQIQRSSLSTRVTPLRGAMSGERGA